MSLFEPRKYLLKRATMHENWLKESSPNKKAKKMNSLETEKENIYKMKIQILELENSKLERIIVEHQKKIKNLTNSQKTKQKKQLSQSLSGSKNGSHSDTHLKFVFEKLLQSVVLPVIGNILFTLGLLNELWRMVLYAGLLAI